MRGFSFTSSFIEQYKREQKKTLEKSKGTQKNLVSKLCHVCDYLAKTLYISSGKGKENSSVVEQDECLDDDIDEVEDEG